MKNSGSGKEEPVSHLFCPTAGSKGNVRCRYSLTEDNDNLISALCLFESQLLLGHTFKQFSHVGHGGPNAASFVKSTLFESLLANPKFSTDMKSALGESSVNFKAEGWQ